MVASTSYPDPERLLAEGERVLGHTQTVRRMTRLLFAQVDATLRRSQALAVRSAIAPAERITNRHGLVAFDALRNTNLALAVTNRMLEDVSAALAATNEDVRSLGLEVYVLSEQLKTSEDQVRSLIADSQAAKSGDDTDRWPLRAAGR
jgi:hypothetical protein